MWMSDLFSEYHISPPLAGCNCNHTKDACQASRENGRHHFDREDPQGALNAMGQNVPSAAVRVADRDRRRAEQPRSQLLPATIRQEPEPLVRQGNGCAGSRVRTGRFPAATFDETEFRVRARRHRMDAEVAHP